MARYAARPLRPLLMLGAATAAAAVGSSEEAVLPAAAAVRVAIVGAGIAGSSAAWFLCGEGLEVSVFEPGHVGGRVLEVGFPKSGPFMVEAGGAAIHSLNEYMAHFIEALGLHRDSTFRGTAPGASESLFGAAAGVSTWDGQRLIPFNPLAFPLSIMEARRLVTNVTSMWQQIYGLQARNVSFGTPHEMLQALGVAELAGTSARDWLRGRLDERFLREFVDGVSRVNYGQDSSINAFADSVSLAGAGLIGSLFSVREGNSRVMQGLLNASGALLRRDRVVAVRPGAAGGYEVCLQPGGWETFASVIIAAPLELAGIDLDARLVPPMPARLYQTTVATFVAASRLRPEFFGASRPITEDTVMTTANSSIPFNSVAVHGISEGRKVYKLFSSTPPSESLLEGLFANRSEELAQFAWHAYPVLRPADRWPGFKLHTWRGGGSRAGGLYYVNAMESPVSCMETEAVGAKNAALLLLGDLRGEAAGPPDGRPRGGAAGAHAAELTAVLV